MRTGELAAEAGVNVETLRYDKRSNCGEVKSAAEAAAAALNWP